MKSTRLLLCALAILAGCSSQELYSQLTERQANEMVAVLRGAGIDADKKVQDGRFSVLTSRSDFSDAVRLLNAQGYPRESFDSMGKVFKREGFVSSPLEERARLVHALSQEISNTLASIDGVVAARVHLVVPERHPLMDKPQPAAASVFIKHRPDKDLRPQVTQIKALVVNSLEGLSYDHVTVALFPAEGMPVETPRVMAAGPGAREASLKVPLLLGATTGGAVLLGSALLWWRRRNVPRAPVPALLRALPAPDTDMTRPLPADFQAALRRHTTVR
ncbi:type III secretion system inner membrane ring lipoprotein SctJ [Pseudaquabacterium terrae]|nr:type III secretion inner membrane ring lipoprotein SctJ [Aquabacterium terrae]